MNRARTAVAVSLAALAAGCARPAPPQLTLYADGQSIELPPSKYCNVTVSDCQAPKKTRITMPIRPGKPAQISIPSDVADTPWLITVQSADARGRPEKPVQKLFTPGDDQLAYTAKPLHPTDRLDVVEVVQISAAMVQTQGQSKPDFLARGIWSVQFTPGK